MVTCQRVHYVTEYRKCYRQYTSCRMVPETRTRCVPHTTCHMEAYCVPVRTCRMVPYCVPVCEPVCLPAACDWKAKFHFHLACRLRDGTACAH